MQKVKKMHNMHKIKWALIEKMITIVKSVTAALDCCANNLEQLKCSLKECCANNIRTANSSEHSRALFKLQFYLFVFLPICNRCIYESHIRFPSPGRTIVQYIAHVDFRHSFPMHDAYNWICRMTSSRCRLCCRKPPRSTFGNLYQKICSHDAWKNHSLLI